MQTRRCPAFAAVAALGALAGAGCGSSSSDATAHIRSADFAVNAVIGDVTVNTAINGGDLNFGETTAYSFLGQGLSDFGFATTAKLDPNIATLGSPPNSRLQLNNNSSYTSYLIGRADVRGRLDQRFLQTVVTGDRGAAAAYSAATPYAAPPSGQANLRVMDAAPDAGFTLPNTPGAVDVLINGKLAFSAVAYPPLLKANGANTFQNAAVPVTPYQAVPSGTVSVQVNVAGTATVVVPPTNIPLSGGSVSTLIVTETAITPVYGVAVVTD